MCLAALGDDMESARSNAEKFLAQWSIRLDDLREYAGAVGDNEFLLLVGSIPEGLANSASDIDLLMVGERKSEGALIIGDTGYEESSARLPGGQEINIEYWRPEDLQQIQRRMTNTIATLRDPAALQKIEVFNEAELLLLHRLKSGVVLANPDAAERCRERLFLTLLADYSVLYWISFHYIFREDAIAQAADGDMLSALWMFKSALDHLGGAMLASVGETNPVSKWRLRLLLENKSPLGSNNVDTFIQYLFLDPGETNLERLRDVTAFCDRSIMECAGRRQVIVPAMMELNKRMYSVKSFEEFLEVKKSMQPL